MRSPHFSIPIGILTILSFTTLLLPSCQKRAFQASIDASSRKYKDKEFNESDGTKVDPATNIGMMAVLKILGGDVTGGTHSFQDENDTELIWASNGDATVVQTAMPSHNDPATASKKKELPPFLNDMYIYTGIQYIGRRSREGVVKVGLHYLEVPVYLMYERDLGEGQLFGGLGPYLALGLWGRKQLDFGGITNLAAFKEEEGGYQRFDAGLNWTIGYRLKSELSLRLGYDIGLVNIAHPDDAFKEWNRTWSLNVAYPIEKIKEKIGIGN
jgi:hypothetical protein